MNSKTTKQPSSKDQIESMKKIKISSSMENGVLKQKLRATQRRIERIKSIEFEESDLKGILKAQKQLQEEIPKC